MLKDYIKLVGKFTVNINKFLKYQIITRGLLSIIIIPIYGLLSGYLIQKDGSVVFTNGDILKFMLTPSGAIFLLFLFLIVVLEIIIEIGGYITISSKIEANYKESSYWEILKYNIRLLPRMLSVGGIIILLYVIFMAPMSGVGFKLSFLKGFDMPNFIMSEIDQNTLYTIIYSIGIILLIYVSLKFIFTFNYMIINNMKANEAIKASSKLFKENRKTVLKELAVMLIVTALISSIVLFIWLTLIVKISGQLNLDGYLSRIIMIALLQIQNFGILIISILLVPFECYYVTKLFYKLIDPKDIEYPKIAEKTKKSMLDNILHKKKTLIAIALTALLLYSMTMGIFTREIIGYNNHIRIYGHRGYGVGTPENSISAIKKSIDNNIDYIEIDVQRTKDRKYVLNHDKTFERVSYEKPYFINKKVSDLNYSQIETLDIGRRVSQRYAGEKVPRIEEVLDVCKNKIKINLELKEGIDHEMIDDLMELVRKKGMKKQVFFTSLNIRDIEYIENKDSTFDTGLIYFIKLGNYGSVDADYMIMEEREATDSNIKKLHKKGKKVIVWTVNTQESIDKFSKMDIDGIITDYPLEVKEAVSENSKLTSNDLILSSFVRNLEDKLLP
ncbi:glycerophosphoryl diester phosphodiesterase membrane domain-containing protein [Peptostreptococcus russellii]|uniref:glycerophosphoryl diester phosphodiesterase membrane domain-containing protein n=1 Tax=Peptostreptococcus russellii TaxID=215200 RepID=UPI003F583993